MSVAPRAAPSISDRSKILSRRGSHRNEEELAVGAVIVMLSDKSDDHSAAAYRLSTRDSSHGDSKLISTATTQKEQSFVAVLAPNCDAAMASLLTQPPGTFLLVKEEDSAIAVYVKFRQAVRALTLVKSKDVKKNDNAIHLAKLRKKELDVTPVHNLRLPSEWYFLVEHCWKRFLPQVQAVVFELCCESHLDEETRLEDWTSSMIPQPAYSVGLMPEACGFYILSVPGNGADSSSVVQVRQVEFDFNKFALTVADGTHKPSALLLATSFSAKRTYEPDFTFGAIRDNFLTPDLVILKETSVNTIPSQQSSLQNCIDLSTNDKELAVLNAADAACCSIMPHEPLPDSLLAVLHEMHICFVNTAVRDGTIPSSKPAHWSTQKKKLVGRIIPILLELLISSATSSEADHVDVHKKRQTLAQFARAIRELNERLQLDATCDDQIGESEMEDTAQVQEADDNFLNALAEVLSWIPKVLLDEWMVLCLKELLQTVNNLSNVVKQTAVPQLKQLRYIRYGYEICKVFAVVLKRASDPDIQVLLVRVLGTDCAAIISLLSFILAPHSLSINGGRDADCIQVNVLNFLSAFVNLDIALPVQTDWESKNSKPSGEDSMNEDAEVIEQLKGELLIRLIGPRMTLEEEQNDQTLWDFVLELMFPKNSVVNYDGTSCMISMAVSFRSLSVPPNLLTTISREYFQLKVAFLSLQQALYTAQDVSLPIDYVHCVASHWRRIEQYCDRIIENEGQEELSMWRETIKRAGAQVSFRSCLILILRAFEEACHCLTRIHKAGICHFDIKSDNILVRSSAHELSRRLLQNNETGKRSNNFKGWLCFADFGEAKCVDTDRIPVRTFTFSSFSSNAASPVVEKRVEKFMSLTRTRGTEAIKSPEVLKIKGSEVAVKVTLASDIWSLGCLLYELVTQELLFQNDDWAGLYAHLVVTQDQHVLRSDHKQKMVTALNPTTSDEEAVVMNLLELCCNILVREPTRRPKLEMIVAQVCNLINDVYALPLTTSDESFTSLCQLNTENLVPEAVPEFRPFTTAPSCRKRVETHGVIVPVRLFWNFFLAAEVTKTQDTQKVASCVGHGENIMAIDVFESKYEDNFVHFVYLSWHESGDSNVHKVSQFFEEIHEEKHRTCFLLNAQLSTDLHLFQQHAAQHFPVIQRRLRDEAGCVVFVALGKDEEDSKTLQGILTNILCFFFRSVVNMSVFDILSCFARECAQFFEYPKPEFLKQLMAYSNTRAEDTETSTMVQCRCGAIVFSVEAAVVAEALTKHSFKPFDENVDDEYPVDTMFVHDNAEEKLVLPLETRGNAIQWVVLDTVSVTRGSTPPIITSDRRMSRFGILKRQASNAEDTATAEPQDLVRGLQRGKNSPSSDTWEMYECELCRLPICALSEDRLKVALPMLHPHSKD
ncbi:hypothetical protein PC115_g6442 [Phytophthora cactorum]|uniref:Protein kinase domain-containing protein n=1 Tax=Phytophthora cactorum TaxID=29920 RepID=A0A8T1D0A8_9STRA|nr:hypothetical protein PC115_g6442 [Phytophthora cactorum]KAG3071406.1 hypothetical protein PC121_g9253 [Phytophthora cactorum]